MRVNEMIWYSEAGEKAQETSCRCCIMRKIICKEVTTGGMCDFFSTLCGSH